MTTKFLDMQTLSIRPQSDAEKILLSNVNAMILSGKEISVSFKDTDMILSIKSKK